MSGRVENATLEAAAPLGALRVLEIWSRHLLVFAIPLTAAAFVWSGPHPWYVAPLFIGPLAIFQWWDTRPLFERRQPVESNSAWPFDGLVYVLAGLHFLMLVGLVQLFMHQALFSLDMVMVVLVVGGSSGFSIITAHELIHRREPAAQWLGRLMLSSVLYEHFYTEHLRGHHVRVGTPEDPATARYGETYREFFRRTVPGQFRSAWALEATRLGEPGMSFFDRRVLQNRVLHGLVLGWGIAFGILFLFGWVPFVAYLLQAFLAVRLLEVVNYFEHWGLERSGRRVQATDSWDTYSWFTYYGLVGLSRHADHHMDPSRPYQELRVCDEAPVLPVGYVALVDMALFNNEQFIQLAKKELEARQLGPFATEAGREAARGEETPSPAPSGLEAFLQGLPPLVRRVILPGLVLLALSLGAWVEANEVQPLLGIVFRNLVIVGVFAGLLIGRGWLDRRVHNGWISWGCAFGSLWLVGTGLKGLIG